MFHFRSVNARYRGMRRIRHRGAEPSFVTLFGFVRRLGTKTDLGAKRRLSQLPERVARSLALSLHGTLTSPAVARDEAGMAKRNASEDAANSHLGRESWVDAAWQMLGRGSLDQVRVDALARHLGVTRGSFYWHFKNRDDLIDAMLERWFAALGLEQRMEPLLRDVPDAGQRLWTVFEQVIRSVDNGQFAALRLWAKTNPAMQQRLDVEDKARIAHMAQQFRQLGFSTSDAVARAEIYHALVASEYLRSGTLPLAERLRRAKSHHAALIAG